MSKNQLAVNLPKREDARAKELADLKRENHELRRKVKRLKKELTKRVSGIETVDVEEEEVECEASDGKEGVAFCGCFSQPTELTLASKTFLICPECKARKRL